MNCDWTQKISSLIDGELPPAEARDVERHLITCSDCQQARSDFLTLRSQISSLPTSMSPVVLQGTLARILTPENRVEVSRPGFAIPVGGSRPTWLTPAVAAFATLILVGVISGLFLYQRFERQQRKDDEHLAIQATPAPAALLEKSKTQTDEQKETSGANKSSPKDKAADEQKTPPRKPPAPVRRPAPVPTPKPGDQLANILEPVRSADAQTLTAMHFERSETLLRAFRNVRLHDPEMAAEVRYERKRAQQLVYQNMMLRREADSAGDVQIAGLLESLEPILIDIANLPDRPEEDDVRVIRERVERKNIVALLQVNSTALARAFD